MAWRAGRGCFACRFLVVSLLVLGCSLPCSTSFRRAPIRLYVACASPSCCSCTPLIACVYACSVPALCSLLCVAGAIFQCCLCSPTFSPSPLPTPRHGLASDFHPSPSLHRGPRVPAAGVGGGDVQVEARRKALQDRLAVLAAESEALLAAHDGSHASRSAPCPRLRSSTHALLSPLPRIVKTQWGERGGGVRTSTCR